MKCANTGRKESLRVETGQHGLSRLSQAFFFFITTVTQPGHEPDLVRVKIGRNSPGIDSNLHTVRVETARYGFNSVWTRFEIRLCDCIHRMDSRLF